MMCEFWASSLQRPYGFALGTLPWDHHVRKFARMKPPGEGRSPSQQPALTTGVPVRSLDFPCSAALWAECSHMNEPRWKQQKTLPANPQNHGRKNSFKMFLLATKFGGWSVVYQDNGFWGFPAVLRIKIICWSALQGQTCLNHQVSHSACLSSLDIQPLETLWLVYFPHKVFP